MIMDKVQQLSLAMVPVEWWWLLLSAAAAALALYRWQLHDKKRLPPGPRGLPIFGNLGIFASKVLHQDLDRLSQQYGPLMSLRMGSKHALVVASPAMAEQVLKTLGQEFASRPASTAKKILWWGDYNVTLAAYGPAWKLGRKIYTTELLNMKRHQAQEGARAEEVSRMIRSLLDESKSGTDVAVDMTERIFSFVMNIMTRIMMKRRFYTYSSNKYQNKSVQNSLQEEDPRAMEYKVLMEEAFSLTLAPVVGDVIPYLGFLDRIKNYKKSMLRLHKHFNSFMQELVDEHRQRLHQQPSSLQNGSHGEHRFRDFVDVMLSLPGEDGAPRLTDDRINCALNEMLNAGSDTTSITIDWGLSELIRCPNVLKKVQSELDSVVGRDRVVVESDMDNLPYLQATIKEVFRLHPAGPLMLPHCTTKACQIGDYYIPANTTTFVNVWSIGRSPQVWENPLEFRPERFLEQDLDLRGQNFQLVPFGSGRRICPGINLALAVVHLTLARLAHSFDWSLPGGQDPRLLDMDEVYHLTAARANPLKAVPRPRLPLHLY